MRKIYDGVLFDGIHVSFDIVSQNYTIYLKQLRKLNHWRRDNNTIGIGAKDCWINISQMTPHIQMMKDEEKSQSGICESILANVEHYIDYAINNKNLEWVTCTTSKEIMTVDRIEENDVPWHLGISDEENALLTTFNAY